MTTERTYLSSNLHQILMCLSLPNDCDCQADACDVAGRKDVTMIARFAGRMTGQAAGYVSAIRSKFSAFTETSELTDVRTVPASDMFLFLALTCNSSDATVSHH